MKIAAINEISVAPHGRMQLSLAHLRNENKSVFDPQQSIHLSSQTLGGRARATLWAAYCWLHGAAVEESLAHFIVMTRESQRDQGANTHFMLAERRAPT